MIYVLNFANEAYEKARKLNTKTAYKFGADKVFEYSFNEIDRDFYKKNKDILGKKRGCGYWLWKPYFIYKTLMQSEENDWVVYADSGMYYRKSIKSYIENLVQNDIDFISRTTKFKEKQYTKRDVFIEMGCDNFDYTESLQRAAGAMVIKNTSENRKIVAEWLKCAQNTHWITDEANCFEENYKEFVDHRHDQSIFSLICKKYDVPCNKNLFMDMIFINKRNALLTYHHTIYGNYIMAYYGTIKRVIGMMWDIVRRFK